MEAGLPFSPNFSMKKNRILFYCSDADRGNSVNGLPYSKIIDAIDELAQKNGFNNIQCARPKSKLIGDRVFGKAVALDKYFEILDRINDKISTVHRYADAFNNKLLRYGREPLYIKRKSISSYIIYYWLLHKYRPKAIIAIAPPIEFCKAAKTFGIKMIEPLHGLGYSEEIPWGYKERRNAELPSHLISFDRTSTSTFSALKKKGIQIIEMDHPWYNTEIGKKYVAEKKVLNFLPSDHKKYKKIILLSLVWGFGDDVGVHKEFEGILKDNHLIPKELEEFIFESKDEVFWCIRRHPVQLRSDYYDYQIPFLDNLVKKGANVEWRMSSTCSLDAILPHIDGHVTMHSMTSYEAALYGVKTLTLCPTILSGKIHERRFSDLEAEGYVHKGRFEKAEIKDWVTNVRKGENRNLIDQATYSWNEFFKEIY